VLSQELRPTRESSGSSLRLSQLRFNRPSRRMRRPKLIASFTVDTGGHCFPYALYAGAWLDSSGRAAVGRTAVRSQRRRLGSSSAVALFPSGASSTSRGHMSYLRRHCSSGNALVSVDFRSSRSARTWGVLGTIAWIARALAPGCRALHKPILETPLRQRLRASRSTAKRPDGIGRLRRRCLRSTHVLSGAESHAGAAGGLLVRTRRG
jgi:hypothetical protein